MILVPSVKLNFGIMDSIYTNKNMSVKYKYKLPSLYLFYLCTSLVVEMQISMSCVLRPYRAWGTAWFAHCDSASSKGFSVKSHFSEGVTKMRKSMT